MEDIDILRTLKILLACVVALECMQCLTFAYNAVGTQKAYKQIDELARNRGLIRDEHLCLYHNECRSLQ